MTFFVFLLILQPYANAEEIPATERIQFKDQVEKLEQKELKANPDQYEKISLLWKEIAEQLIRNIKNPEVSQKGEDQSMEDWRFHIARDFQLLKRASRLRARIIYELREKGQFNWSERTLDRMFLEIKLIPYKFRAYLYEKSYWFKETIGKGFWGFVDLIWEVFLFLLILGIPFLFIKLTKKLDRVIDRQKKKSFYLSLRSSFHRKLIPILSVISAYLMWFLSLVALNVVEFLLEASAFSEISFILPYAFYYVYYKIFRVTLEIFLQEFADTIEIESRVQLNKKIKNTSRFLGLFLLIVYSLRSTFKSILGESIIFQTIEPFFGWITLFLLFFVSHKWKKEISIYLNSTGLSLFALFAKYEDGALSYILSFPLLLLVVVHFITNKLLIWSSQFDLVKLIYARILRIKFETTRSSDKGLASVGDDYKESFLKASASYFDQSVFETKLFKNINKQVKDWLENATTEQTVAIYGPKGCGVTTFIDQYRQKLEGEGLKCLCLNVPAKTFTEKALDALLEPIKDLSSDEKVIVFMDNAHNFFLSTIGGFETYKRFLEKTEETRNVFFVVGFSDYAWMFLNSVLGENQYFRLECSLPRWHVEEIKDLILTLNSEAGYSIEYDPIFRSSQKVQEGVTSSESRYFYLLWERSSGNPGSAIYYWFRSLKQIRSNHLKVCLPIENQVSELSNLHQEMHFVYASLFRHENLTISEAARATNLPRSVVKQAIYRGLEEGFIVNRDGRYKIAMNWVDDLRKFLKGKNLIYESQ